MESARKRQKSYVVDIEISFIIIWNNESATDLFLTVYLIQSGVMCKRYVKTSK